MTTNYWQLYLDLKQDRHFYPRDGAWHFGISECELLLSNPDNVYLGSDIRPVVLKLKNLGKVECIARNNHAVHEKSGFYENVSLTKTTGIALNVGELDLRIFAHEWKHILAVIDNTRDTPSYSIQFFDAYGEAIQKVFLRDLDKVGVWRELVNEFAGNDYPIFCHYLKKHCVHHF